MAINHCGSCTGKNLFPTSSHWMIVNRRGS
jgi:hypothetical protein